MLKRKVYKYSLGQNKAINTTEGEKKQEEVSYAGVGGGGAHFRRYSTQAVAPSAVSTIM